MSQPTTTATPEGIVAQFVNLGGATVELRTERFTTRYTAQGRPYVSEEPRTVNGYVWICRGCTTGSASDAPLHIRLDHGRYLPNEAAEARRDANTHASTCRALPQPEVQR
ncbi:hypothetical protein [Streptomyces sp. NPDC057413]|uniref:hypothetical protein n=1 Tax=Streptomyces sp. NPDC057413 TaxID=3346124 RepID=UPI00368DBA03